MRKMFSFSFISIMRLCVVIYAWVTRYCLRGPMFCSGGTANKLDEHCRRIILSRVYPVCIWWGEIWIGLKWPLWWILICRPTYILVCNACLQSHTCSDHIVYCISCIFKKPYKSCVFLFGISQVSRMVTDSDWWRNVTSDFPDVILTSY